VLGCVDEVKAPRVLLGHFHQQPDDLRVDREMAQDGVTREDSQIVACFTSTLPTATSSSRPHHAV
jgi:hypothetical protein